MKNKELMSAEEFVLHHFPEMDKKCVWYPVIVAVADGYLKYVKSQAVPSVKLESYDKEYELLKDYEDPNGRVAKGVIKKEHQWMSRFALLNPGDCGIKTDWFKEVKEPTEQEKEDLEKVRKYRKEGVIFDPVDRSIEEPKAIPYQRCPICNGHGTITQSGYVNQVLDTCPTCKGERIIPMRIMGREADKTSDKDIVKEMIRKILTWGGGDLEMYAAHLLQQYNVTRK